MPRPGFAAVAADVRKPGFVALRVRIGTAPTRAVLVRGLAVIGSVAVATGAAKNLHELPLAASLLDRGTIALAPATSIDRLLRALPGFDRTRSNSAFTNYGQLRASFSGAGNDRGAVLVDGIPAQDGFGGQIDWQAYPTDEVQRVELLRGAGSALYGSGAIGGALDIATFGPRTGAGLESDGRLTLGAGANSDQRTALSFRTPLGPTVGLSLSSVATRFAYRDLPPSIASPLDHAAVSTSGTTHLRARFADGRTTIEAAGLAASDHQDEGRPNYAFDRSLRQGSLALSRRTGAGTVRLAGYARDTTVDNLADVYPARPGTLRYAQHVPTTEHGYAAGYITTAGTTGFSVTLDGRRVVGTSGQVGPTGALQALGSGAQSSRGAGVQVDLRGARAEAVIGVRADAIHYENLALVAVTPATSAPAVARTTVGGRDEGALSPRVALRYDLSPALVIRASSGGGFRAPYLNELVRGFNIGSVVMAPNPFLVPERSRTDSAGLDVLVAGTRGRLAFDIIQTHINNAIAFATVSPTLMQRRNVARTQTDGETLAYAQQIGRCGRVRASATTQYARVIAGPGPTVGKRLAFVPERSLGLGFERTGPEPLAYALDASYVGQTFADDLERQPLGAALLVSATVRATTRSGISFSLSGDNLTHQRYLSSLDRYGQPLGVALRIGVPLGPRVPPSACGLQ
ncbi:MAG: hypothetical protein NVSMB19_05820 [Vulcanimicrobiaceae bacterium]